MQSNSFNMPFLGKAANFFDKFDVWMNADMKLKAEKFYQESKELQKSLSMTQFSLKVVR